MYSKVKIKPHNSTTTFTSANSFTVSGSSSVLVTSRKNTEVGVYTTSDGGSSWTLLETISEDSQSSVISLPESTTHVNFTSNRRSKHRFCSYISGYWAYREWRILFARNQTRIKKRRQIEKKNNRIVHIKFLSNTLKEEWISKIFWRPLLAMS